MKAIKAGQYVKHFQYGCGVVTESNTDFDRTTIDFDLHGIKKFVTSLMMVEPAEGTPPPKRSRPRRRRKPTSATSAAGAAAGAS